MGRSSTGIPEDLAPSLAAGAAHDLRNLLFVIGAHCDRLLGSLGADQAAVQDLQAIRDAAARGTALARQIVKGHSEERLPQPVDVNEVIRGVLPLASRLAGDRVALSTSLSPRTWRVTANAVQVEQIVMNLVVNARDAMLDGGRVAISTENRSTAGPAGSASQAVVISVADTGPGIDPAVLNRIFEPFFTTKAASGGTGVGLATVRAIALLHGGHVEVSSTPGGGATLRVVLPRAEGTDAIAGDGGAAAEGHGGSKRILLVENERSIRDYLHRCLTAEGYDVQVASSGQEALHLCDPPLEPVDLVVTDVHLPDIEGPDVARRLRARWPGMGVVFMSGGIETLADLSDRGRVPVLAKPFTTSELVSTVRTALTTGEVG
jgi:CheY-like chemotaxis protein